MMIKIVSITVILSCCLTFGNARADGDFTIGPDYKSGPELEIHDGVPKGVVHNFTMRSDESNIYPGRNGPYQRPVWVYVPAQYVAGTAAPFIVVQDGSMFTNNLVHVLDNMIQERRLPAMIAIMIAAGSVAGIETERGLEYNSVSDHYTMFIEKEVLPRIEKDYNLKLTTDPNGRAAMGVSSGAAAAFTMAWFHPELYRRVLSYSGTFVSRQSPEIPAFPHGAWEYHEHLIPQSEVKPIRIWLEAGEKDMGSGNSEASMNNWIIANQRMAAALKAKGYHYEYFFARDADHGDPRAVDQTLPEALSWLWQGYPDLP